MIPQFFIDKLLKDGHTLSEIYDALDVDPDDDLTTGLLDLVILQHETFLELLDVIDGYGISPKLSKSSQQRWNYFSAAVAEKRAKEKIQKMREKEKKKAIQETKKSALSKLSKEQKAALGIK